MLDFVCLLSFREGSAHGGRSSEMPIFAFRPGGMVVDSIGWSKRLKT